MKEFNILKVWASSKVIFDELRRKKKKKNAELFDELVRQMEVNKSFYVEKEEKNSELEKVISKHCNRVIGFIKHQEGEYLSPLLKGNQVLLEASNEVILKKEKEEEKKSGSASLEELNRKLKLSTARWKVLEGLSKVRERKSLLGKTTLEFEGVDSYELEEMIQLLSEIDPDVY